MPNTPSPTPTTVPTPAGLLEDLVDAGKSVIQEGAAIAETLKTDIAKVVPIGAVANLAPELVAALEKLLPAALPSGQSSIAALLTPAQWQQLFTGLLTVLAGYTQEFLGRVPHSDAPSATTVTTHS